MTRVVYLVIALIMIIAVISSLLIFAISHILSLLISPIIAAPLLLCDFLIIVDTM